MRSQQRSRDEMSSKQEFENFVKHLHGKFKLLLQEYKPETYWKQVSCLIPMFQSGDYIDGYHSFCGRYVLDQETL